MVKLNPEERLDDVQKVIDSLLQLIGNVNTLSRKFLFRVDSGKLDALKRIGFLPQSTTMQQLVSSALPREFSDVYGSFDTTKQRHCFVGDHLYMECIYDDKLDLFFVTLVQSCTLDRTIKQKRLFRSIEGAFCFIDAMRRQIWQSDNRKLYSLLMDNSSDLAQFQKKMELFDDLFGTWEKSLLEAIDSIKNRCPVITYSSYVIHERRLSLHVINYSKRDLESIPIDTSYIFENLHAGNSGWLGVGTFDEVTYDYDTVVLNIHLSNNTQLYSLRQHLDALQPLYEDFQRATSSFRRQLAAINALKKEEYNAPGLTDILLSITAPGSVPLIRPISSDVCLDEFQKKAVAKALTSESISLIQGPPGTGKTRVIGELLRQIFLSGNIASQQIRVLIVSQSNPAVDNVLENIQEWIEQTGIRAIRIGYDNKITKVISESFTIEATRKKTVDKVESNAKEYVRAKIAAYEEIKDTPHGETEIDKWKRVETIQADWLARCGNYEMLDYQLISSAAIIAGTCLGYLANNHVREMCFDYVIVDEAAKATTPELLVSIIRAKRIVLVGDQNQLPPFADEDLSPTALQLVKDPNYRLFDLLYNNLPDASRQQLLRQYRMIQNIGDMISSVFYQGSISTGVDDEIRQHHIPSFAGLSIIWYSTSRLKNHRQNQQAGGSFFNNSEVDIIKQLLREFDKLAIASDLDIGVITGYSAQKDRLHKSITSYTYSSLKLPIIDTLDAFQGRENNIIIYSTVRTERSIGFQKEKERINVAFSRAKCLLIICGDLDFFYNWDNGENKYIEIIDYMRSHEDKCKIIELEDGMSI